jgi:hypothetical protein
MNLELSVEISRRGQLEAQLRRAQQNLARREAARTSELASLTAEQQSYSLALETSQQGISDFIDNATIGLHWLNPEEIFVSTGHLPSSVK